MFIEKRVQRIRQAIIRKLTDKSVEIMSVHAAKPVSEIPWIDTARATIFKDLADMIRDVDINERPEDKT